MEKILIIYPKNEYPTVLPDDFRTVSLPRISSEERGAPHYLGSIFLNTRISVTNANVTTAFSKKRKNEKQRCDICH